MIRRQLRIFFIAGTILLFFGVNFLSFANNINSSFDYRLGSSFDNGLKCEKKVWDCNNEIWTDEVILGKGQIAKFKLTIVNEGTATLTNITVKDILPSQFNFILSCPLETSIENQILYWELPEDLNENNSYCIQFVASVSGEGMVENTMNVTAYSDNKILYCEDSAVVIIPGNQPCIGNVYMTIDSDRSITIDTKMNRGVMVWAVPVNNGNDWLGKVGVWLHIEDYYNGAFWWQERLRWRMQIDFYNQAGVKFNNPDDGGIINLDYDRQDPIWVDAEFSLPNDDQLEIQDIKIVVTTQTFGVSDNNQTTVKVYTIHNFLDKKIVQSIGENKNTLNIGRAVIRCASPILPKAEINIYPSNNGAIWHKNQHEEFVEGLLILNCTILTECTTIPFEIYGGFSVLVFDQNLNLRSLIGSHRNTYCISCLVGEINTELTVPVYVDILGRETIELITIIYAWGGGPFAMINPLHFKLRPAYPVITITENLEAIQ